VGWRRKAGAWFGHLSPEWQVRLALTVGLSGSNAVGILVVFVLLTWVLPIPVSERAVLVSAENLAIAVAYVVVAGTLGIWNAWRVLHPVVTMLRSDSQDPTDEEKRDVLAAPRRIFFFQAFLWACASVLFFGVNARTSMELAVSVVLLVGLAGWTTSCLTYLLAERALRPVSREVMRRGLPNRRFVRSVADRAIFAWALGTGVAVIGVIVTGALALTAPRSPSVEQLAITVVVLGGLTLLVGFLSSFVAAQASSEPIRSLREALAAVEQGDLDASVPIYDSTEIGMLQAGFNDMVHGLREREELRDLFGRHVGEDVAKVALERGIRLGGEEREVAVLFVDIVGSTSLADERPPDEVVSLLNKFFEVVIEVVHEYDGWINKFEGDAALAIWGAPVEVDDMCTAALAAARVLGQRIADDVPDLQAGVGVSCGTVVAGNVGTTERYEYTVIGDPVNEAARLTEHAKEVPAHVVASKALVEAADESEAKRWTDLEPVTVRGRKDPTAIVTPA
jgi:adenylate cyclase